MGSGSSPGVDGSELRAVTPANAPSFNPRERSSRTGKPVIERYVRVASPARGTTRQRQLRCLPLGDALGARHRDRTCASGIYRGNLATRSGDRETPDGSPGNPRHRSHLPDSHGCIVKGREPRESSSPSSPGTSRGKSLAAPGVQLTDWTLFDRMSNDLVDSDLMYEGLVRDGGGYGLFDRGHG